MVSIALWSFAVFMASVFAGLLTGITLTPKYKGTIRAAFWTIGAVTGYILAFVSYSINLYNDAVGIQSEWINDGQGLAKGRLGK